MAKEKPEVQGRNPGLPAPGPKRAPQKSPARAGEASGAGQIGALGRGGRRATRPSNTTSAILFPDSGTGKGAVLAARRTLTRRSLWRPYPLSRKLQVSSRPIRESGDDPMSRFSSACGVFFGAAALLVSAGAAHALCSIPEATYQGGAYGAYAMTGGPCSIPFDQNGGTGSTTAAASSSFAGPSGSLSLSSTADLATGVLTAYSQGDSASSSIWDTFTYSGTASRRGDDHGDPQSVRNIDRVVRRLRHA